MDHEHVLTEGAYVRRVCVCVCNYIMQTGLANLHSLSRLSLSLSRLSLVSLSSLSRLSLVSLSLSLSLDVCVAIYNLCCLSLPFCARTYVRIYVIGAHVRMLHTYGCIRSDVCVCVGTCACACSPARGDRRVSWLPISVAPRLLRVPPQEDQEPDPERFRDVQPQGGTLVLFRSDMPHEVPHDRTRRERAKRGRGRVQADL